MLMITTKLLLICVCWVIIIDFTDIIADIEVFLEKYLKVRKVEVPKPFSCSLCMTFWTGLIYLIIIGEFSLASITILLLISFFSTTIYNLLYLIKDIIDYLLIKPLNTKK